MKVLHLISGGDTGGAKTHIINLCSKLKNLVALKIICFMYGQFYEEVKDAGIDIDVIQQSSRFDLSVVDKIAKIIENENYDIIHCHGARANFIGMFLKLKIKNKPFITTVHSDFDLDFQDSFYKRVVFSFLNKLALKRFDYFVSVGSALIDKIKGLGVSEDRIFLLYNGFDFSKEISYVHKDEFLSKFFDKRIYENKIVIGNLSRLYKVKGLDVFIKAANIIVKKYSNVLFLIGGSGPQRESLNLMISEYNLNDKVFLLGSIKNPYDFFNSIDINVISSYSETFPYSILEATALEKCCISSKVGSVPDLIDDGKNGFLFDAGDYRGLAQKIEILLQNENLIKEFGHLLSKKAKEKFSAENMARMQFEIYKSILSKK
ncbi:glycosyl transferase group 1 [Caldicellulosiruptor owensensis OL]|uniref:Glycosyl transferase group 1 n=1 Tax=Caldicellulosiruptor owensensis (strain ATCC 700167 / DSM 13100 / OL) TaxID=632518 RepID=E4Q4K7_CALOW|nr:glycosyltransferase [Caldicellulosiruptor owensensis]ADQ05286.1 glycosyl transferase group 1 [Caldicellulosiruptor owensensis OL]